MEINRRKLKLMIKAVENEVSNEKLQPAPKKEDKQFYHQLLDGFYGVDRHWDKRAKFKEKIEPKKIKRRSEEQYDLPDLPPSKLESGMYGDLHYDRDAVGEVCGINE